MLWSIVALLLALADLAERAGGRSAAVRHNVLYLLRPAEAVAFGYFARLTRSVVPITFRLNDDSAAEAMRLAHSFRALAALLAALPDAIFAHAHSAMLSDIGGLSQCAPAAASRLPVLLLASHQFQRRDSS